MRLLRSAALAALPLAVPLAAAAASTSDPVPPVLGPAVVAAALQFAAVEGADLNAHNELRQLNHRAGEARNLVRRLSALEEKLDGAPNGAYARWIDARLKPRATEVSRFASTVQGLRDEMDAAYHTCRDGVPDEAEAECLRPLAARINRTWRNVVAPDLDSYTTVVLQLEQAGAQYDQAVAAVNAFIADPFIQSLNGARPAILLRKDDQPAYLWAESADAQTLAPNWTITVSKVRRSNDPRLSQIPARFAGYPVQVLDGTVRR